MKNWAFLITADLFSSISSSAETFNVLAEKQSLEITFKLNNIFAV